MIGVVTDGMVSRCLQGEGFVETVSREITLVGGGEVKPIGGNALLREVPAAVRAGTGRRVFVLLAHSDRLPAVEATLRQGAHVLLGEVALWVAAGSQQLLALCRGGGEAIRVRRCVQSRQERTRREYEKKKGVISCPQLKLSFKHLAGPHALPLRLFSFFGSQEQ